MVLFSENSNKYKKKVQCIHYISHKKNKFFYDISHLKEKPTFTNSQKFQI